MSKKIEWRWYDVMTDAVQVETLHHKLERKIGRTLDLPDLSRQPVIAVLVGETDGQITHGLFLEVEVEVCAIGGNPLPAEAAQEAAKLLIPVIDFYKIRIARSFIPAKLLEHKRPGRLGAVGRLAQKMGFTQEGSRMTSWFRWMKGAK